MGEEEYETPKNVAEAGRRVMSFIMAASIKGNSAQTILLGVTAEVAVWSQSAETPKKNPEAIYLSREGVA
jgi:hypothetical protein